MLCCGGDKDSGRDMKSAQNTPSRQPLNMGPGGPYGGGVHQPPIPPQSQPPMHNKGLMPPPLTQAGRMMQANNAMQGQNNSFDSMREENVKKVGRDESNYISYYHPCTMCPKRL